MKKINLDNEAMTEKFGESLAKNFSAPLLIFF